MILRFRDRWLREFFARDQASRNIPPDLERQAIQEIATNRRRDIGCRSSGFRRVIISKNCEAASQAGIRVRVNDQRRLIFRWDGGKGEAAEIYLDKHNYR